VCQWIIAPSQLLSRLHDWEAGMEWREARARVPRYYPRGTYTAQCMYPGRSQCGRYGHLLPRPLLLIALAGSDLQPPPLRRPSLGCNGSGANRDAGMPVLSTSGARFLLDAPRKGCMRLKDI
jgi:hypothetical protein